MQPASANPHAIEKNMNLDYRPPRQSLVDTPSAQALAPDIEWMLQSDQVDEGTLLRALLREAYAPLHSLLMGLLEEPLTTQVRLRQALAQAVLRRHEYRAGYGARAWLFSLALEEYPRTLRQARWARLQARLLAGQRGQSPSGAPPAAEADAGFATDWRQTFRRLKDENRLLLLLHLAHGFSAPEIGWILKLPEEAVQTQLHITLVYTHLQLKSKSGVENFAQHLTAALRVEWPEQALNGASDRSAAKRGADQSSKAWTEAELFEQIRAEAMQHEQRRRRFFSLKEIAVAGLVFVLMLVLILLLK